LFKEYYSFYCDVRNLSNTGGVGIYVKNCFTRNILDKLKSTDDKVAVENV